MIPNKIGQVAKFHTPFPHENPDQLFVVLEIKNDHLRPRADIKALNTGLFFSPINTVPLNDLEIVELKTSDLVGQKVTLIKKDRSKVSGKVIKASKQKILLDLTKGEKGIETNVFLAIQDDSGKGHSGNLFVPNTQQI
jgi:hypothetical protein